MTEVTSQALQKVGKGTVENMSYQTTALHVVKLLFVKQSMAIFILPVSLFHSPDTFCIHKTILRILFGEAWKGRVILFRVTGHLANLGCMLATLLDYQQLTYIVKCTVVADK